MGSVALLEYRPHLLDFISSGQGQQRVTALYADGLCLADAVSLMEFGSDELQVEICEECGTVGCKPGGWICIRRLGDSVLWVPCFERMVTDGEGELAPPRYMQEGDVPRFTTRKYSELKERVPGFPAMETIPQLSGRDAIRIVQVAAPAEVLGRFPEQPCLRAELVVASGFGNTGTDLRLLSDSVERAWNGSALLGEPSGVSPMTLHVEAGTTREWCPIGTGPEGVSLCLGAGVFALLRET